MKNQSPDMPWIPAFDELGEEFARIARAKSRARPRRRRLAVALVGLSLVATPPVAVAVMSEDNESEPAPPGPEEAFPVPAPGSPEALQDAADQGLTLPDLEPQAQAPAGGRPVGAPSRGH